MDSSSSSTSSTSALNLAMAALVGASLMAVSAFYIHKRSVDQVIDRLIEIRRKPPSRLRSQDADDNADEEEEEDDYVEEDEQQDQRRGFGSDRDAVTDNRKTAPSRSLDEKSIHYYRISSSLPNADMRSGGLIDEDAKFDPLSNYRAPRFSSSAERLNFIPSGLPPLRTGQANESQSLNSTTRMATSVSVGRLTTPRSHAGLVDDSDEEGTEYANEDDCPFNYENGDANDNSVYQNEVMCTSNNFMQEVDGATAQLGRSDPSFARILLPLSAPVNESISKEDEEVQRMIRDCLDLRKKYLYRENVVPWRVARPDSSEKKSNPFHFEPVKPSAHCFRMEDGVVHVYARENESEELYPVASATTFFTDLHYLLKVVSIGNVRSVCHHRLRFLDEKYRVHHLLNEGEEFLAQKSAPHRDFYNIRKVDTHVHHSACMNQKHLLNFIKSKLKKEPDEVVIFRDGKYLTLKEVFKSLDLTGYDLNVDLLDVHADKTTFHRFDKFNLKYNPCGQSRLREIFLKQDNLIQGRFLAEVTKEVLKDLEAMKYQMAEYRISVYGRKQSEWDQLASWFVNNDIYSENVVWLIQLPRLYNIYKKMGIVTSFQNILDNVFIPLFEVTVDPNSHPQLHLFLKQVVGFDVVDDESRPERRPTKHMPTPSEWTNEFNPAYSYYAYYCYANLYTLNKLRESKGMTTIKFRPHCGEAGDVDHLAAGFLVCHNISHGINLRYSPVLQYLYYLGQVDPF
uniref:AMP deaminase-like isoform X2 n=1 Tax=Fragaria vesca subsp. vesca TaxID=101020 RepID=UPI0005CB0E0F|nr:PREDICTED: AMP deaminase-like isoform X2 [Fragaria vesca subsp. vesca]